MQEGEYLPQVTFADSSSFLKKHTAVQTSDFRIGRELPEGLVVTEEYLATGVVLERPPTGRGCRC